ncbi:MAG: metallophosphoesterase [Candidatus Methanoperedens sp.]|nr:metallophosphoesterase [Candidatus Methanoperedens sp.]
MKIIAISDTHISSGSIIDYLPEGLMKLMKTADIVIHTGDFITKQVYDELKAFCRLEAVHGNMDEMKLKILLPERKSIDVGGVKIGIVHEATLSINDTTGARYLAKEMDVDILIFGHIHKPLIEKSDVLLVCPGSPTSPRLSELSAVELVIQNREITGKVITFEGTRCSSIESMKDFHARSLKTPEK